MKIRIKSRPLCDERHAIDVGNVYRVVDVVVGRNADRYFVTSHTTGERVAVSSHRFEVVPDSTPTTGGE